VTTDTLRTVALTAICCGIAALFVLRSQERRYQREMHQAREMWRKALWQARVAAPVLSRRERAQFNAIAARLDDAGLEIFGSEEEQG
jgi:hypothetical protein